MLHDPSFWVMVAFVLFVVLAFKPLYGKISHEIQNYRDTIARAFDTAEAKREEARSALKSAEAQAADSQKLTQEIRQNTASHIRQAQQTFQENLEHIKEDTQRTINTHKDVMERQLEKQLRSLMLETLVTHAQGLFCKHPLGVSQDFLNALTKKP